MHLKTLSLASALLGLLLAALPAAAVTPPDYKLWGDLLAKYYDPAKGMNYKGLKANDKKTLDELRHQMAQVDVGALPRTDQLAYWINLYNISVVNVVVEHYPVASIRDISTDFITHLNVFKKPAVKTRTGTLTLDEVENDKIRDPFKDPRIHFAINCAAKSCPPIRSEPYVGSQLSLAARRPGADVPQRPQRRPPGEERRRARDPHHQDHGLVQGRLREVERRPGRSSSPSTSPPTSASRSRRPPTRSASSSTTTTGS